MHTRHEYTAITKSTSSVAGNDVYTFVGVVYMYLCIFAQNTLKYTKPKITEMTVTTKSTTPLQMRRHQDYVCAKR